jgi:hypothetical protein
MSGFCVSLITKLQFLAQLRLNGYPTELCQSRQETELKFILNCKSVTYFVLRCQHFDTRRPDITFVFAAVSFYFSAQLLTILINFIFLISRLRRVPNIVCNLSHPHAYENGTDTVFRNVSY